MAAFVQSKYGQMAGSGTTIQLTFDSPVTSGNLIVVCTGATGAGSGAAAVTDSQSNAYTQHFKQVGAPDDVAMYSAFNVVGGSSFQVTFNPDDGSYAFCTIMEFSGMDVTAQPDVADVSGSGSGGTASAGPTATTTIADCVAVGVVGSGQGSNSAITPQGGYITAGEQEDGSGFYANNSCYLVLSGTGAQTVQWTMAAAPTWAAGIVVFRGTGGGGGGQDTPELRGRPQGLRGHRQLHQLLAQ